MSNLSNVCLSIRSSNNKTSTARGYASNGKALISFTNNAVKYVYNTACNVNASTTNKEDASIIKVYTTDFWTGGSSIRAMPSACLT